MEDLLSINNSKIRAMKLFTLSPHFFKVLLLLMSIMATCLKKRAKKSVEEIIPCDVMLDILSRLPVKVVSRLKLVCKEWYNLINSSNFIKLHVKRSVDSSSRGSIAYVHDDSLYIVHEEDGLDCPTSSVTKLNRPNEGVLSDKHELLEIIGGSCHGLLCIGIGPPSDCPVPFFNHVKDFIVCNPTTRRFKRVSTPRLVHCWSGFGYDYRNDDYKIVLMTRSNHDDKILGPMDTTMLSYSLKEDAWTGLQPLPEDYCCIRTHGIYGNNMLHFIIMIPSSSDENALLLYRIARFELSSQRWEKEFCFPKKEISYYGNFDVNDDVVSLGFLDGCVRLCYHHLGASSSASDEIEIWMMKVYGVEESWTKLFCVRDSYSTSIRLKSLAWYGPITYSKLQPQVVLFNRTYANGLFWFDTKADETTIKECEIQVPQFTKVELCVPSLVSIPGSTSAMDDPEKEERIEVETYHQDGVMWLWDLN